MKPIPEHLKTQVAALKQTLLSIPEDKRKAAVDNGLKMFRLKRERDALLKDLELTTKENASD